MTEARPLKRTPERRAMMLREYPHAVDAREFLARLNALPGPPVASQASLRTWAREMRLRKTPEAIAALAQRVSVANLTAAHAWQQAQEPGQRSRGGSPRVERQPKPHGEARTPPPVRTADRRAMMLAEYADTPNTLLHERLNALPGDPIRRASALCEWAGELGLRKTSAGRARKPRATVAAWDVTLPRREFVTVPPDPAELTPEQQAAIADEVMERRRAKALDMLRRKKDAVAVAGATRLPLREVFRLSGELRRERAAG